MDSAHIAVAQATRRQRLGRDRDVLRQMWQRFKVLVMPLPHCQWHRKNWSYKLGHSFLSPHHQTLQCSDITSIRSRLRPDKYNSPTDTKHQPSTETAEYIIERSNTSYTITTACVESEKLEYKGQRLPLEPTAPSIPTDIPTIQPRARTVSDSVDPVESESLLLTPTTGEPPPAYYTVFMAEHKRLPPEPLPSAEENTTRSPSDTD